MAIAAKYFAPSSVAIVTAIALGIPHRGVDIDVAIDVDVDGFRIANVVIAICIACCHSRVSALTNIELATSGNVKVVCSLTVARCH